jgi:hypothetical protein
MTNMGALAIAGAILALAAAVASSGRYQIEVVPGGSRLHRIDTMTGRVATLANGGDVPQPVPWYELEE